MSSVVLVCNWHPRLLVITATGIHHHSPRLFTFQTQSLCQKSLLLLRSPIFLLRSKQTARTPHLLFLLNSHGHHNRKKQFVVVSSV